jgi:hypothetical protein
MAHTKQTPTVKPQVAATRDRDVFDQDLRPDPMAGQNIGAAGPHPEKHGRTMRDHKQLHARFIEWSDDELDQIPVVPAGSRLEQNATYLDLESTPPREFTATGDLVASPSSCYVAKTEVPYQLWNRLRGVTRSPFAR